MHVTPSRQLRFVVAAAAFLLLAGCAGGVVQKVSNALTPYKVEVVQGNFVSREQVQALQPGMTRDQVRQVLGTPLVTSLFHGDRWDYVFTMKRQGVEPQQRRLTVFFKGEGMDHVEGDTMPSESEFVATLDRRKAGGKVPRLEATEEELRSFGGKLPPPVAPQAALTAPSPATNYPPLEAPAR